jgi:tRNA (guanine37-N1)-methyltransferase
MTTLKDGTLICIPKISCIVDDPDDPLKTHRLVLLSLDIQAESIQELPEKARQFAMDTQAQLKKYLLELDYSYWTHEQILRSILPDELEVPNSFETVGHIAHLNLRDEYLPFKHIIGQVLLDKAHNLKTVVNKVGTIHHTYRFFQMEVLAGEDNLITAVKESNCLFELDFSKVYWNSRLQGEHDRLYKTFKQGEVICDVFAGIGPFALPAAKNQKCVVFANDLNPDSFAHLTKNIHTNKVVGLVRPYNMDGREFIKQSLLDLQNDKVWEQMKTAHLSVMHLKDSRKKGNKPMPKSSFPETKPPAFHHYVMNLPATAIEFLDAFKGLYKDQKLEKLPLIHCYCFSKEIDNLQKDVVDVIFVFFYEFY